jgi:predicted amidophosphoribosyltransferase
MKEFVQFLRHSTLPTGWLRWTRQLLPPLCWKCGVVLGGKTYLDLDSTFLCSNCLLEFPWTDPLFHCRQYGNHTDEPDRVACQECLEDDWDLAESQSRFAYNEIIRHWILQLKFFGQELLSPILGRLLALSFQNSTWLEKYDSIVPIPLHSSRLCIRGFNHSLLLAYHLRKNLRK